ncbi:hypothetical protein [Allocoleopsis sp.]|uniref:hypothetical protein n=1 Tax=Allocoleopsis sp. TaxID=3088169 RepID=UPI002FD67B88
MKSKKMPSNNGLLYQLNSQVGSNIPESLYRASQGISNTIISLQYSYFELLIFKVHEAINGAIVHERNGEIVLQCEIRGTQYRLTHDHLEQMSNRECSELFNQLGVDGNQLG